MGSKVTFDDKENEKEVDISYDLDDDCSITKIPTPEPSESEKSEEVPEGIMLQPDHPLLARFQIALKDQLTRLLNKLTEEVFGLETSIKKKTQERDGLGIAVYDAQQMVMLQHESVDKSENEIKKLITERREIEEELDNIKQTYDIKKKALNESEKKELDIRNELESLNFMYKQMADWESKLKSDLAVQERISKKTALDKKLFTEEKRQLDFICYKLMTEVFRLENSLEHLEMQLRVKEKEREELGQKIADATTDIESLEIERKRLMHSWNCVLVAIGHRDKSYFGTKQDLEKERETLNATITEISTTKKMSVAEMSKNEELTITKERIDQDKSNLLFRIQHEKDKLRNTEKKMVDTQNILAQINRDLEETTNIKRVKEQEMDETRREMEKQLAIKFEIEERIVNILQERMTNDKISKYMNKTIREMRERNRSMDIQLAVMENKNSDLIMAIERQKIKNTDTQQYLEESSKEQKRKEGEVNDVRSQVNWLINQIKKKQYQFDQTNKKCEELLSAAGGVELTPQEVKIKTLERQISELDDKNNKLKTFWLRQQRYIVQLEDEKHKQANEVNLIKKQIMMLQQKNIRLEDELDEFEKQEKKCKKNMETMKSRIDKINDDIFNKRDQKSVLDANTISFRTEYIQKLQEEEYECITLESELTDLEDTKMNLSKELIEYNREALSWEAKLKMAAETKATIAAEKSSEGEIGTMKAEIHRMTVRHSQLRRAQEKLVQDLNHCLSRREFIVINSEAIEKKIADNGKCNNRINFRRKLDDVKGKVKKTVTEKRMFEKKLCQAIELESELNENIKTNENIIKEFEEKIIIMANQIENAKYIRQTELETVIYKQHKLHQYTHISKGQYRPAYRSPTTLETEFIQHKETNMQLQSILENLIADFPNHKIFAKILHTLKLVHESSSKSNMEGVGAYGGGKAGGSFDPISFVQRPQVILRAVCWLFSIIVFGCISSQGWQPSSEAGKEAKEYCLYNDDPNACNYGVGISVIAFLASMGFIAGEYLFEQMSSVKTRKHYVLADLGFSGFWSFLFFVGFCYLAKQWGSAERPSNGVGVNNVQAAIAFSFFSIITWAGCAFFAFQRFRQGAEAAFAPSYEVEGTMPGGAPYTSYPIGIDGDQQYQEPPFSAGPNQRGPGDFQAPAY